MDQLWSPWRYRYVSSDPPTECLFCTKAAESNDEKNYVVLRAERNFILLNLYPYTSDHQMAARVRIQIQENEIPLRAQHHVVLLVIALGGLGAEKTLGWRIRGDIPVSPRTPQLIHALRACAFRRHGAVGGRGGIVIDQVFQFLARLEIRDALGGNFYAGSRLRIASHARLPLAGAEAAETADLDFIPATQSADDAVEDRLDNYLGILARHLHNSGDFLDQFRLGHVIGFPLFLVNS